MSRYFFCTDAFEQQAISANISDNEIIYQLGKNLIAHFTE